MFKINFYNLIVKYTKMKNLKLLGNNESNVSEFLNVPKEEGICQ